MIIRVVGCSHHRSSVETREQIAFSTEQTRDALNKLQQRFPTSETVLLSTCNRTELYAAALSEEDCPTHQQLIDFIADYHCIPAAAIELELFRHDGEDVVRHLFTVAASLDSMVVGEAQILSQVKQAYDLAAESNQSMTVTHGVFQAALRVAKRVASQTSIHKRRVSIPSVAIGDFAKQIFERFDDKKVLVIGAGEMAEETLTYLRTEGAKDITVVNRTDAASKTLAAKHDGRAANWNQLPELLVETDLVVSTTGATEPIVKKAQFDEIEAKRGQKTLFILDLAIPRDFEPAIAKCLNVYLYSLDDLQAQCEINQKAREREWPAARRIIEQETAKFSAELKHRARGPTIRRLKELLTEIKDAELVRLFNKLNGMPQETRQEIERSFDRLVNKLLHPPLESLRDETQLGSHHSLLDALRRLFQIKE